MEQVLLDDDLAGLVLLRVLIGLAVLAVVLSASAVFAVLSFSVGRRTPEIGVRMALGATRREAVSLVVKDGLSYAAVGLGLGMLAAWGAAKLTASELYGVTPADPVTFVASALALMSAVVVASWIPARAASRLSPLLAIRNE